MRPDTMTPYQRILVAVDNSRHSDAAVRAAAGLARGLGAEVVGFHAYAAQLHEQRFGQMEPGLPSRYDGAALQQQRDIHESLISQGLRLISESYLEHAQALCAEVGTPFQGKVAQGRNYEEIVREARVGEYDLVVLGALGLGARRRSVIGSVCERVLRAARSDVLVARGGGEAASGILVAIDGSPNAYHALERAIALAAALDAPLEAVTVYDPQFHIVAFRRLAKVLSEEAAATFRFKEQEALHGDVIDKGLEKLYRGFLARAEGMASSCEQRIGTALLTGKAFQSILDYADERQPWLLVAGRAGQHGSELADIGSTTENLVRLAPCSVLVVGDGWSEPPDGEPLDMAHPGMPWSPEAEARLGAMPEFARSVVREAVERYARESRFPNVTVDIMNQARHRLGW